MDAYVSGVRVGLDDRFDEEFVANGLGPADILLSVESLPAWDETPRAPPAIEDDGNPNARACVGVSAHVSEWESARDGPCKVWSGKFFLPPGNVVVKSGRSGMRHERMGVTVGQHGLQFGEIRSSFGNHVAGMQ